VLKVLEYTGAGLKSREEDKCRKIKAPAVNRSQVWDHKRNVEELFTYHKLLHKLCN
jgi:hypothetical protein